MSKKDGAVFSKALFGYKKRDVNEYIRLADESNSEKMAEYEARMRELQNVIAADKASYESEIRKLNEEKATAAKDFECFKLEFENKIEESEARCASYLKLADAASLRAESAETRIAELSSELELKISELQILKERVESDKKQIEQLNDSIACFAAREDKERIEKAKYFKLRRPAFFRIVKK